MKVPQAVEDKIIDVGNLVLRNGPLSSRERALVALGCSIASCCTHCNGALRRLARKLEATQEEIEQVEAIAARVRQRCANEAGLYSLTG